jgi:hypothetical protein
MTGAGQAIRPSEGLFAPPRRLDALADLLANVWQFGYVTTDLHRAIEFMSERFGLEHCLELPAGGATFLVGDEPAEWDAKFAMGARGGKIVELIEPVGGHVEFYTRVLPQDGSFAVRLHHIATFIENGDDEWERLGGLLAASAPATSTRPPSSATGLRSASSSARTSSSSARWSPTVRSIASSRQAARRGEHDRA